MLILETDGGGVRGYSSLLILRELMKQIAALEQHHPKGPAPYSVSPLDMRHRPSVTLNHHTKEYGPTRASSHYLPCHYFDYIAGTSTGGCTHFTPRRNLIKWLIELQTYRHHAWSPLHERRRVHRGVRTARRSSLWTSTSFPFKKATLDSTRQIQPQEPGRRDQGNCTVQEP